MSYLSAEAKRQLKVSLKIQEVVKLPEDIFQVDSGGAIWMYDKEVERWIGLDGSLSKYSPKEMLEKAKEQDEQAMLRYREIDTYSKIRVDVLTRDNHTCQVCMQQLTRLHIHHILPRSLGGTDHTDNLITVCNKCHGKVEYTEIPKSARKAKEQNDW